MCSCSNSSRIGNELDQLFAGFDEVLSSRDLMTIESFGIRKGAYEHGDLPDETSDVAYVPSKIIQQVAAWVSIYSVHDRGSGSMRYKGQVPRVSVRCKGASLNGRAVMLRDGYQNISTLTNDSFVPFPEADLSPLYTISDILERSDRAKETDILWVDSPAETNQSHSALAVIASFWSEDNLRKAGYDEPDLERAKTLGGLTSVQGCLVDALWADALHEWSSKGGSSPSDVFIANILDEDNVPGYSGIRDKSRIAISSAWLSRITSYTPDFVVRVGDVSNYDSVGSMLSVALASFLSDWHMELPLLDMSDCAPRDSSSSMWLPFWESLRQANATYKFDIACRELFVDDVHNDPHAWEMRLTRNGVGYNGAGITVQLALAVLTLYCVVASCYLIFMLVTGEAGSSWDSIGELFMLALNSPPPPETLGRTSAGVETLHTFQQPVSIRVNGAQACELVFENNETAKTTSYSKIVPNFRY